MTTFTRTPAWVVAVSAFLAGAGLIACTGSSAPSTVQSSTTVAQPAKTTAQPASTTAQPAQALQVAFTTTVGKVLPSVVEISTATGLGSGVILDTRGDIATNAHVVGNATTFRVRLANTASTYSARLVGTFPPDDLAVIRMTGANTLHPATLGDSNQLQTGDIVMAVGNPLGLSGSVTDGIVSALGRTVDEPQGGDSPGATIPDTIQTSAAINPGNSGGALVDLDGQVIGIPTLAAVDQQIGSGSAAPGIGFAIASNMVRSITSQLISQGKVTNSGRAALGVSVETVTDANGNPAGAGIASVIPNGPAASAGLTTGDVITKVGGTPITSAQDLANVLAEHTAGQQVTVTVKSASTPATRMLTVKLGDLAHG
jgi:putative serine protease PepD